MSFVTSTTTGGEPETPFLKHTCESVELDMQNPRRKRPRLRAHTRRAVDDDCNAVDQAWHLGGISDGPETQFLPPDQISPGPVCDVVIKNLMGHQNRPIIIYHDCEAAQEPL